MPNWSSRLDSGSLSVREGLAAGRVVSLVPAFATVGTMRLLPVLFALFVPLFTGCVGSVALEVSPEESFAVGSATWLELKTDDGVQHALIVTNRGDTCEALQGFLPSATTRYNEWFFAGQADCTEGKTLFTALGQESAEIKAPADNWMWIFLKEGTSDNTPPVSGDYVSAGDPGYLLDVGWYRENPWVEAANIVEDVCQYGTAGGILAEVDPFRSMLDEEVGGDLKLTVDGESVTAVGWVKLLTEDNEDAGNVEYDFTATHCTVDVTGNDLWWMP